MRVDPSSPVGRAQRLQLGRDATLRDPSRTPLDVLIDNLSETGALLKTGGTLPVGTLVSLGIPGAAMQFARIVRTMPGALAAEFLVPLDPQQVKRALAAETLVSVAFPQIPAAAASRPSPRDQLMAGGEAPPKPLPGDVARLDVRTLPTSADAQPLVYGAGGDIPMPAGLPPRSELRPDLRVLTPGVERRRGPARRWWPLALAALVVVVLLALS